VFAAGEDVGWLLLAAASVIFTASSPCSVSTKQHQLSRYHNYTIKLATSPARLAQVLLPSLAEYAACTVLRGNLQLVANHSVLSNRWYQPTEWYQPLAD